VPELEPLVRNLPLRERLRAQLMLSLYRGGRRADSLDVYRRGRSLLADELGLEPGEALKQLERAILAQDPALGGGAPAARPVAPPAHPGVPTGTVSFLLTDVEGPTRLAQNPGD